MARKTRNAVAIYARVSTDDKGQNPENQLRVLRRYVKDRGWSKAVEFVEHKSGTLDPEDRPQLKDLMARARRREFDTVIVWAFDRFARSTLQLIRALDEFRALGVDFISHSQSLDTTTPMGRAMFTVIAALAELEHSILSERAKASQARRKEAGDLYHRPRKMFDAGRLLTMFGEGNPLRTLADEFSTSRATVSRRLQDVFEKVDQFYAQLKIKDQEKRHAAAGEAFGLTAQQMSDVQYHRTFGPERDSAWRRPGARRLQEK